MIGWAIFFFISVGCFVLMNLITAVIVEKAFDIANQDEKVLHFSYLEVPEQTSFIVDSASEHGLVSKWFDEVGRVWNELIE